eukprot:377198_1
MFARNLLCVIVLIQLQCIWCSIDFPFYSSEYKVIDHGDQPPQAPSLPHLPGINSLLLASAPNKSQHQTTSISGIYKQAKQPIDLPALRELWDWVRAPSSIKRWEHQGDSSCNLFMTHWFQYGVKGYDWALSQNGSIVKSGEITFLMFETDEHHRISVLQVQNITIIGDKALFDDPSFDDSFVNRNPETANKNACMTQLELDKMRSYDRDYPYFPDRMVVNVVASPGPVLDHMTGKLNGYYKERTIAYYHEPQIVLYLENQWNLSGDFRQHELMSYKPVCRLDDGRALYLYPARDADHTYLWAVTWMQGGGRQIRVGTSPSSTG